MERCYEKTVVYSSDYAECNIEWKTSNNLVITVNQIGELREIVKIKSIEGVSIDFEYTKSDVHLYDYEKLRERI